MEVFAMATQVAAPADIREMVRISVDEYLAEKQIEKDAKPKKMALIATKGTLDMAYPPLILATPAASLGWEVGIFFTFYGLNIIHKNKGKHMKVAPLGNPAMPMPVPNLVGAIPGMTAMGTMVMKSMFKSHGVASIDELLEAAVDTGVRLIPCAMTIEVFGYKDGDFIKEAEAPCGAATFIDWSQDADICLFI
jgi:peroxiredoxin family protein